MADNYRDKPLYSIEDDEPSLYNIEEETPLPGEDTYDLGEEEDYPDEEEEEIEEEEEAEAEAKKKKAPSPLGILFKTMLGPAEGWKSLKRARFKTDEFAARCFYPLVALAAFAEGSILFYEANMGPSDWAMQGLSTFISFFFGYFTILLLSEVVLPKKSREVMKKEIGKQFVMLALSTFAIFWTAMCLLPMFEPVLVFLPLWTVYLVFKGVKILRVPKESENSTTALLCVLIIAVPILWNWLVSMIL